SPYLGLTKPITYAQSLTLYAMSARAPAAAGKDAALVIGNPLYDNASRAEALRDPDGDSRAAIPPALPFAGKEARGGAPISSVPRYPGVEPTAPPPARAGGRRSGR